MNVLSLFDGMSCCYLALKKIGIQSAKYYASEIDKFAIKAAKVINPNTTHIGSVTDWREWNIDFSTIDLVTGGFPCQAWSMAGKQLGDKDERGMLFWVMLDIMKAIKLVNPKVKFLIENVRMKKEFEDYITHHTNQALGEVNKILINSTLVSAQNRKRFYWCNWSVEQPLDKGILLKDVIEYDFVDRDKSHCLDANYYKGGNLNSYFNKNRRQLVFKCGAIRGRYLVDGKRADNTVKNMKGLTNQRLEIRNDEKTNCLTTVQKDNVLILDSISDCNYRKLTPRECGRLQTVPENIIDNLLNSGISNTQLYKMFGNGWTVDVIAHIFSHMKLEELLNAIDN